MEITEDFLVDFRFYSHYLWNSFLFFRKWLGSPIYEGNSNSEINFFNQISKVSERTNHPLNDSTRESWTNYDPGCYYHLCLCFSWSIFFFRYISLKKDYEYSKCRTPDNKLKTSDWTVYSS